MDEEEHPCPPEPMARTTSVVRLRMDYVQRYWIENDGVLMLNNARWARDTLNQFIEQLEKGNLE